jgi:hypothetical protein
VPWLRAVRLGDSVYLSELPRPDEPASEIEELYARGEDPAETRDLLAPERVDSRARSRARQGRELLGAHLQGAVDRRLELLDGRPASWVRPPDEELARELRALGYADD